jgi:hypothetical protein
MMADWRTISWGRLPRSVELATGTGPVHGAAEAAAAPAAGLLDENDAVLS